MHGNIILEVRMKCPCGQYDYKATSKSNLERHRSSVHVLIRYPCEQCKYQATVKDSLERHRRAVHEGMK